MKLLLPKINNFQLLSFAICLLLLALLSFKFANNTAKKEHLCISVEHERNCQLVYISFESGKLIKYAFVDSLKRHNQPWLNPKKLKESGFTIQQTSLTSKYDYSKIFKLLSDLETQGWSIQGFGSSFDSYDDLPNSRFNQFLMIRNVSND